MPRIRPHAVDHTQNVVAADLSDDTLSFQFQVGSAKPPDDACEGVAEAFYRLQQAVGMALNHDDMSITPAKYMDNEAAFGVDFERCGNEATTHFAKMLIRVTFGTLLIRPRTRQMP